MEHPEPPPNIEEWEAKLWRKALDLLYDPRVYRCEADPEKRWAAEQATDSH